MSETKDDTSDISSSVHMDRERSSDHTSTAGSFKRRKLARFPTFASKPTQQEIESYLKDFCTTRNEWSWEKQDESGSIKQYLLEAIMKKENGETAFDSQLFDAWKKWFNHEDKFVFLKIEKRADASPLKAIALTRQLSKEKLGLLRGKNIGVATDKSINDHAVVLLS